MQTKTIAVEGIDLSVVKVPVHQTFSAKQLGTFQPETWVAANHFYLSAQACSLDTRALVYGDNCFRAGPIPAYGVSDNIEWERLFPSHPIGAGSLVILDDTPDKVWSVAKRLWGENPYYFNYQRPLVLVACYWEAEGPYGRLRDPQTGVETDFRRLKIKPYLL